MVLGKISLKHMPDMGEAVVLFSHMTELAFGANIYHFFLPMVFHYKHLSLVKDLDSLESQSVSSVAQI